MLRRDVLRERDQPGVLNIKYIEINVRWLLIRVVVVVDGIFHAARYGTRCTS